MRQIVAGMAGHVDHGKTALVRAMTGVDTDRLKEEKERGLTTDLGFAPLRLPSGNVVGLIDVPGHEKFIGNMLAGAGGIDLAILVVAADEGPMPQTTEHLSILDLLGVRCGVVVLSKSDLVEPDWLELVTGEVRTGLRGTFLETAPIIPASSRTREGIAGLVEAIDSMVAGINVSRQGPFARLPIDRAFVIKGSGTVVTGTLWSGSVNQGETVEIMPGHHEARVRSIEVFGERVDRVLGGQRVALNLVGVSPDECRRGTAVVTPGSLEATRLIDVRFKYRPLLPRGVRARNLKHATRAKLYLGTSEVGVRVMLLGHEVHVPGDDVLAQLACDEPVVAVRWDRFILRAESPGFLLGGGTVLFAYPPRRKHSLRTSEIKLSLFGRSTQEAIEQMIAEAGYFPVSEEDVAFRAQAETTEVNACIQALVRTGRLIRLAEDPGGLFVHRSGLVQLAQVTKSILGAHHSRTPWSEGLTPNELRSKVSSSLDNRAFGLLIHALEQDGVIKTGCSRVALAGHCATISGPLESAMNEVEGVFLKDRFNPPDVSRLNLGIDSAMLEAGLHALFERGVLMKITGEVFHRKAVEQAEKVLLEHLSSHGSITLAAFRDALGTSRRCAQALLEYFDGRGLTKRTGDVRVLASKGGATADVQ